MSNKPPFKTPIFRTRIPTIAELISTGQKKAEDDAGVVREKSVYGTGELNMNISPQDQNLCMLIAQRGAEFMRKYGVEEDTLTASMDIATVHLNDRPLRLLDFLHSEVTEFAHDYSRIRRCLNRTTGRLSAEVTMLCFEKARQ